MHNKKFIFITLVLVLCIILSSCSKNNDADTPSQASAKSGNETDDVFDLTPESKKIVVWINTNNPEDPYVNDFIQKYPDYEVDHSVCITNPFANPDFTIDLPRLGAAVASNTQPDLFTGAMAPIEAYYTNLFIPLDDYLTHDPEYNFDTVEPNLFITSTFNGKVYFIPSAYDVQLMIWNKDLFENKGLDPERIPETWSEFKDYLNKLVSYDSNGKLTSIGCRVLDWWTMNVMNTGEQYTDETGMVLNLDTPSYLSTIEFIKSIPDSYGGNDKLPSDGTIDFFKGGIGMMQMVSNGVQRFPCLLQHLILESDSFQ